MNETVLTERGQQVLKLLIEHYIGGGQPVGSKTISHSTGLSLSPASIRNVMADLEEQGFIVSPHTSAGRIPTVKGYRFFVDSLITMQPLGSIEMRNLHERLLADLPTDELFDRASRLLSELSRQAGLVTLPRHEEVTLRQIEFLPLSGARVLVILVCNEKEVQNRVIDPGREFGEESLRQAANYINRHFAGRSLVEIRSHLIADMQSDKDRLADLMQAAIDLAQQALAAADDDSDYVMAGESHLIDTESQADMQRLKELFRAFEQKKDILHLMERCIDADGTQVYIGEESGYEVLDDYSIITTPYQVGGAKVGVLGVIGPTRMPYERVIPLVDITARLLSAALDRH